MAEPEQNVEETLLPELLEVIQTPKLRTFFQPIVDLRSGEVFAYEALSRGPPGVLEMPAVLYHQAALHSVLPALDEACCLHAVLQARSLPAGVRLFVNVLPSALAGEELGANSLAAALERSGLPPDRFVLELTESVPLPSPEVLSRALREYRHLGASIAIDDYGTGYANLASLMAIRPEFLKLDRSLTAGLPHDPLHRQILQAMQGITESYGAAVIAEGIEHVAQLEALIDLGIPFGQGELLAPPAQGFSLPAWPF